MPGWYNLRCLDCSHTEYRYRNVKTCRQCGGHNVERVPDMPHVDTNAPLATNSDAAMWRQDHASACRYIEVLLAERKRWAGVIALLPEAREALRAYNDSPPFTEERCRAWQEHNVVSHKLLEAVDAALAGEVEGSDG